MGGIDKIMWPPVVTDGGHKGTIMDLCASNPSKRLPMLPGGPDRLRNKRLFSRMEWVKLRHPTESGMKVPLKPTRVEPGNLKGRAYDRDIQALQVDFIPHRHGAVDM